MIVKEVNPTDIKYGRGPYNSIRNELTEFWKSEWDACEVDVTKYASPVSCYNAYHQSIKRTGYRIRPYLSEGKVYLVKLRKGEKGSLRNHVSV